MTEVTYLTIGPVAQQLGIARWKLAYLIERGAVPGPSVLVPGRRLFTADDVRKLREALREWAKS
jgi:DNA-binding transcriptional MerR regulator